MAMAEHFIGEKNVLMMSYDEKQNVQCENVRTPVCVLNYPGQS
jgi:hypothetical protein